MRANGLYVITDAQDIGESILLSQVEQALLGGATMVQYREKHQPRALRQRQASQLLTLCQAFAVPLLVNDDVQLAADIGAHGVHLGSDDTPVPIARQRLGAQAIIGVSCYNQVNRAHHALAQGADYVAFGRFFASYTKPGEIFASLDLLRQARAELSCPIVAIGGITADNAPPLIKAGADFLAVIHGVFGQPDIQAAARRLVGLFSE